MFGRGVRRPRGQANAVPVVIIQQTQQRSTATIPTLPPFTIVQKNEDCTDKYVLIKRTVGNGANQRKKEYRCIRYDDSNNKELMILCFKYYQEAAHHDQLRLNTEDLLFGNFEQLLGVSQLAVWRRLITANGWDALPRPVGTFILCKHQFIRNQAKDDACLKLTPYMEGLTYKPRTMSPRECWERLTEINNYAADLHDNPLCPHPPFTTHTIRRWFKKINYHEHVEHAEGLGYKFEDLGTDIDELINCLEHKWSVDIHKQAKKEAREAHQRSFHQQQVQQAIANGATRGPNRY